MNRFTAHCHTTENPQTYWVHGKFAFTNSLMLIWAGIIGCIHAWVPPLFPFYTSTRVIRSYITLANSRRHKEEIIREMSTM